ncbi:MAG TPA: type IX secretion system membrane protein PorP/SprF [Crocinitomix sp.]|nr:type IX secretion system membrane protein PorP/SprF [Crocinitomix sp.]
MKRLIIISLFSLLMQSSFAQQQFVYTNYLLNNYYYNPAIVGSVNYHQANIGYRKQWVGFDGSPATFNANFYGSYKNQMKHGYGVSLNTDKAGLMQRTAFYVNYAYHIDLNDKVKLALGVRPGYLLYNVKLYNAILADVGDDILTGNILTSNAFDLASGLNLYSNKFFIQAGMHQMLGKAVKFTDFNDGLSKQFTFIGGYNYQVKKKKQEGDENIQENTQHDTIPTKERTIEKFVFQPSLMVRYTKPIPAQLSFMFKTTYNDKLWLGLSFRTQDAAGFSAGINVNERFIVGYAYDYAFGQVKGFQGGSHEIMLRFITTNKTTSISDKDEELNNSIFEENKKKKNKN